MQINEWNALLDLDRRAVQATLEAVRATADLTRPTPCAAWSLADLLAHLTAQQLGFARAAAGERTTVDDWTPVRRGAAVGAYADACAAALDAFAAVPDPAAAVLLPEIRDAPVPARIAVGFHLVDNVVHAWDVAVSTDGEAALDADVVAAALLVARQVPDGAERDKPEAAFAHALPVAQGTPVLEEILLLLGRDPAWSPA